VVAWLARVRTWGPCLTRPAAVVLLAAGYLAVPALEVRPLPVPAADTTLPAIAAADASGGVRGAAAWTHVGQDVAARLWMTQGESGLLLRLEVDDPVQQNDQHGQDLQQGDSILFAWDGRGDTQAGDGFSQLDDGLLIAALTIQGPEALVLEHGDARFRGPSPELIRNIHRDSAAARTEYELLVPWPLLASAPGISSRIAVAVTIAHRDADGQLTHWGHIQPSPGHPRVLNPFQMLPPLRPVISIAPGRPTVPAAPQPVTVRIAWTDPAVTALRIDWGDQRWEQAVPVAAWQRWMVQVAAADIDDQTGPLQIELRGMQPKPLLAQTVPVIIGDDPAEAAKESPTP
jgi:hypothetical protein